ncbi:exosortase A [Thalassotalea hakodatensis]|uniref:exosortase A n=1 Tax=Thalassotalea hakodatensis TaxID=3030492 RepID=UPI0025731FB5|nr:exosortase A [Thalassotalea hakodatensis]
MQSRNAKVLLSFSLLMLCWGWLFADALMGMEAIWRRSDTFAHGYFILPIAMWLVWRNRAPLLIVPLSTSWQALVVLLGSVGLGLIAAVADVNVVSQLAAVVALIAIFWLVIGNKLARVYKFPLIYLLFLVPMGENLIPWLQDVTAWFTVFFLQLTGVPVFRDGLYIQTPSGLFEVAVACSGIRYLIASAAVGALFAYLNYTKLKKQIIFFLFALILPILANGIRAYLIVAIAHYSDMKYATGADHLVYGWLFFGFVIMMMFWVGGKFVDEEQKNKTDLPTQTGSYQMTSIISASVLMIIAVLLLRQIPVVETPNTPQPMLNGTVVKQSNWGITFSKPIAHSFITDGTFEVFAAKYANKQTEGELISFTNKLHDAERWTVIEQQEIKNELGQLQFVLLRNTSGKTRSYVYQYVIGQYSSVSSMWAKLYQVMSSLTGSAHVSYVIAVSLAPSNETEQDKQKLIEKLSVEKNRLGLPL